MIDLAQKAQKKYLKIDISEIKVGVRYSAPVFFDDGECMFLAEGKSAKQYHVNALKRWSIPFLLSYGHQVDETQTGDGTNDDEVEELEVLEEVGELEEVV